MPSVGGGGLVEGEVWWKHQRAIFQGEIRCYHLTLLVTPGGSKMSAKGWISALSGCGRRLLWGRGGQCALRRGC